VQERCGGEGGQAEAGEGGVLEVRAGVGEEDEGHGWWEFGLCAMAGRRRAGVLARARVLLGGAGGCWFDVCGVVLLRGVDVVDGGVLEVR